MGRRRRRDNEAPGDFTRYDAGAQRAVVYAGEYAVRTGQPRTTSAHLAFALATPGVREHLDPSLPTVEDVERRLTELEQWPGNVTGPGERPFDDDLRSIIRASFVAADEEGHDTVGCEHLLVGLLARTGSVGSQVLRDLGAPDRGPAAWRTEPPADEGDERPEA